MFRLCLFSRVEYDAECLKLLDRAVARDPEVQKGYSVALSLFVTLVLTCVFRPFRART